MAVVPLARGEYRPGEYRSGASGSGASGFETREESESGTNWIRYAAVGTLAASGVLLVTGQRRIGLIAAVSGAALALMDQQDVVRVAGTGCRNFWKTCRGC